MKTTIPKVFDHGCPDVFLEQASVVADLLGCANYGQCDTKTVNSAGLLIWNLLDAARELIEADSAEQSRRLAAVKA